MSSEIREQIQKLDRITLLESIISNNDTIEAINESIDSAPAHTFNSAEEMINSIHGKDEE